MALKIFGQIMNKIEIIPLEISPELKAFIEWFTELQEWSRKELDKLGLTKEQLGEPAARELVF